MPVSRMSIHHGSSRVLVVNVPVTTFDIEAAIPCSIFIRELQVKMKSMVIGKSESCFNTTQISSNELSW